MNLFLQMLENFHGLHANLAHVHALGVTHAPVLAFWPMLALAAAGGLMGMQQNKHAKEVEDADRKLQAELTRYSWVDGAQQGNPNAIHRAGSIFGDIGQGALAGGMFGQQFNKPAVPEKSWWEELQKKQGAGGQDYSSMYQA